MADATYQPLVYRQQGGDILVVASGGDIKIEPGGTISNDGTQASAIADLATGATNAQIATAFNTLLVAVEEVGILATS